ncbi:hypothetical protein AVEN_108825-1 [Araneus ventricosus]|uniref:Uncharacterized protein n=1 Tax=Araneus ventricosus TaxID=182803 RepID=A0A4Y2CG31_ARAVE|nr:hypothetical protein AVEN_108825-1 [Araneus ventricosus]
MKAGKSMRRSLRHWHTEAATGPNSHRSSAREDIKGRFRFVRDWARCVQHQPPSRLDDSDIAFRQLEAQDDLVTSIPEYISLTVKFSSLLKKRFAYLPK